MKKKTTIGGAAPKPAKNTTGATNRTSGYLNPNAALNKGAIPKPQKSKIKITGSAKAGPAEVKKTFKPGSIATSSKNVTVKPAKKASTSYSPKPFDTRAAAVKRGEASRKELASKVVKAVNKTARYTPMGVIGQGAVKAGRILSKVIPKK